MTFDYNYIDYQQIGNARRISENLRRVNGKRSATYGGFFAAGNPLFNRAARLAYVTLDTHWRLWIEDF
jgi:hypothetical protein